jgi:hypothetical protein
MKENRTSSLPYTTVDCMHAAPSLTGPAVIDSWKLTLLLYRSTFANWIITCPQCWRDQVDENKTLTKRSLTAQPDQ